MDYAFALVRAVHLAATIAASGAVCFAAVIAEPAMRRSSWLGAAPLPERLFSRMALLFRISLILALLSGAGWFVFIAASISDHAPVDIVSDGTARSVLLDTQFGQVWLVRLAAASALLALSPLRWPGAATGGRIVQAALAAVLLCGLAWTGHAGASVGIAGALHLLSDIVHFAAAGAWIGGLAPLALLIGMARRKDDAAATSLIEAAAARFSVLGMVSVAAILLTGVVNACLLLSSVTALYATVYGRILTLKVLVFAAMVAVAGVNRFVLSPRLPDGRASGRLARNCWIEAALGVIVLCLVGMLTLLSPAPPLHADHSHAEHLDAPGGD